MTARDLHFVVPGPLEQRTGGYLYDAHMVAGLRGLGWRLHVHELGGSFPCSDSAAHDALSQALASLPDGARVIIDGLAMGGLPGPVRAHGDRLRILSLVHHPLAEETGLDAEEVRLLERTEREALGACVGVVVSSAFTARQVAAYGVPTARVRAVVPGTDPASPAEGPGPDLPPALLCVASITPRKGHDVLVRALDRVRDLDWTCACAGSLDRSPRHAERLMEQVAAAGLADRIDFVGELAGAGLSDLYRKASVFVLASHYEGYGMALTEALARGLPVVSTTGGAIPFTVPGEASILVEPGDDAAMGEALRALLTPGSEAREALGEGARRHAQTLPTWPEAVAAFAAAVEELAP